MSCAFEALSTESFTNSITSSHIYKAIYVSLIMHLWSYRWLMIVLRIYWQTNFIYNLQLEKQNLA